MTPNEWDQEYGEGVWDYLSDAREVAHYAVQAALAEGAELGDARVSGGNAGQEAFDVDERARAIAERSLGEREPAVGIRPIGREVVGLE